jgi:hypothetical protein
MYKVKQDRQIVTKTISMKTIMKMHQKEKSQHLVTLKKLPKKSLQRKVVTVGIVGKEKLHKIHREEEKTQ